VRGALVLVWLLFAAHTGAAEPLTSERAVALALERNVELAVRAADLRATRARLDGARAPFQANPELGIAAGPRSRDGDRSTDVHVELSQRLEIFGTRGARIDAARGEALTAESVHASNRTEMAAQARVAFARALAAERLATLAEEELALSRDSARVAARRNEVGDGARLEVNAARVEVGRAVRGVSVARQRVEAARAELRLVSGIPAGEPLQLSDDADRSPIVNVAGDAAVERALARRADLASGRLELEAARAGERLASREWLPQPRLGASYAREEGANVVLGAISFDLPVWNRNVAGRGTASARVLRAEKELESAERRVRQEVLLALARLETAREAARAYDAEVVTAVKESFTLTTQAYQAGKIGLVELLLIRRSALEARRGEVEALAELAEAEAELVRALGGEQPNEAPP
jgi:outer membrane protein, heavy metal efflux system